MTRHEPIRILKLSYLCELGLRKTKISNTCARHKAYDREPTSTLKATPRRKIYVHHSQNGAMVLS